jgi:guanine nucleotide-binding protein G(i) subunit alpha
MPNPADTSDATLKLTVGDLPSISPELRISPQLKPLSIGERFQLSHSIDKGLGKEKKARKQLQTEPKLLILGTSDSGKSTVLKQLQILHGGGIPKSEYESCKKAIRNQIILTCRTVLEFITIENGGNTPEGTEELVDLKLPVDLKDKLEKIGLLVNHFWKNESVRKAYQSLPQNQLPETNAFFMKHISRIFDPCYEPTNEDWLKLRTVTNNISETVIKFNSQYLHFFDVSGVKSHRKYWVSYFDDVTAILFVASLASYNQTMLEDDSKNRLMDSLVAFEGLVNNPLLMKTGIILFLNKRDLFEKKIKKISIKEFFPEYEGK